jgi:hypothetical protein
MTRTLAAAIAICSFAACGPYYPPGYTPPPPQSTTYPSSGTMNSPSPSPQQMTPQQYCRFNCSGCCLSDGTCVSGTSNSECGYGGQLCNSCPTNQRCEVAAGGGSCGSCSQLNCSGCCTLDGRCVSGTSSFECGYAGQTCVSCSGGALCDPTGVGGGSCY